VIKQLLYWIRFSQNMENYQAALSLHADNGRLRTWSFLYHAQTHSIIVNHLAFSRSYCCLSFSSALVFVCCCYALIIGVALTTLLTQQIVLISFNITSYEWRRMPHEASFWSSLVTSPYNEGTLANWAEFIRS
jgi:hypothetical protein